MRANPLFRPRESLVLSPLATIATDVVLVRTKTPSFFDTMAPAFAAVECLAALVAAPTRSPPLKQANGSWQTSASIGSHAGKDLE